MSFILPEHHWRPGEDARAPPVEPVAVVSLAGYDPTVFYSTILRRGFAMLWEKQPLEMQIDVAKKHIIGFEGRTADFRQVVARQVEALKMLGAAHATLAGSIVVFLTASSAPRSIWVKLFAKLCFLIFVVGLGHFAYAYWRAFRWERRIHELLMDYVVTGKRTDLDDPRVAEAAESAQSIGPATAFSLICLCVGSALTFFGILVLI
jgi:hypothetical protein